MIALAPDGFIRAIRDDFPRSLLRHIHAFLMNLKFRIRSIQNQFHCHGANYTQNNQQISEQVGFHPNSRHLLQTQAPIPPLLGTRLAGTNQVI